MCGVVGICSKSKVAQRQWLAAGRDAMNHRGPDDAGEWWSEDGQVGFAHRRLAIIDLSTAGHQPMRDAAGELTIVFNGEIYNFKELRQELTQKGYSFRSNSDTEVLLAGYREWGKDFVSRLNGMFAFALHDARANTVLLVRDRAGEKPLFYRLHDGELRFASELKALLADSSFPRRVDPDSLDCYLTMGFVPGERCILQGVNKLPPAHALLFNCAIGSTQVWRYWSLPEVDGETGPVDEEELLDELETLFEDAVGRQLVSDVPVGVLLSGGVDSSLVTAMAVRGQSQLKTYTVGLPGYEQYDETQHARLIARHFDTDHTELQVERVDPELLPRLARQYDEPLVDSSMIPTFLVSQLVRQHCTVALGGDGGDELFGGYHSHNRMALLQQRLRLVPQVVRRPLGRFAETLLPIGITGRQFLIMLGVDIRRGVPLFSPQFDQTARKRLLSNQPHWSFSAERIRQARIPSTPDAVQRITRMDFANYMAEDILVKVDRASMLNSLELRSPLLDYRIIEFAFRRVPSRLKATTSQRKLLLKKLAKRLLPPAFDQRRKQGFGIPLGHWLKGGAWRNMFQEVLLDDQCVFSRSAVEGLFRGIDIGRPVKEQLFGLALFELWRREYRINI